MTKQGKDFACCPIPFTSPFVNKIYFFFKKQEIKKNIYIYQMIFPSRLLHGSKSSQSVFKDVDPEWVVAADVDVDPHVKLAVVYQVRATQIFLDDDGTFTGNLVPFVDDLNPDTTRRSRL